ncbi:MULTISPECIES: type II toxin-antitoxin system VapC family toxin [unclassified Nocardia]|uniref:type II toxin-antitoxin system VapC family toxin n=1 Tax=unclassified Nocardia TaxID=2637762 RepID=UPI0033BA1CEC
MSWLSCGSPPWGAAAAGHSGRSDISGRIDEILRQLQTHRGSLVVPTLVITEAAYLIGTRLGAEAEVRFLGDFAAGLFAVEPVHPADWLRIAELVAKYRDLPLGTADASVVAVAERRGPPRRRRWSGNSLRPLMSRMTR